jgi:O-6-methylguanine DNA methyltransferase
MTKSENMSKTIYETVKKIPKGKVASYGQISNILELNFPRLVGKILHNNPDPKSIPCHRVVFKDGKLAECFAFGGRESQELLLKEEGVKFNKGKVDMKKSKVDDIELL